MIINFTQHRATPEQIEAGVAELIPVSELSEILTFVDIPTAQEIRSRAEEAAKLISSVSEPGAQVMIGGAPFFMGTLEAALKAAGFKPVYAFSERKSVDVVKEDGSVVKTAVFVHKGFVEV